MATVKVRIQKERFFKQDIYQGYVWRIAAWEYVQGSSSTSREDCEAYVRALVARPPKPEVVAEFEVVVAEFEVEVAA